MESVTTWEFYDFLKQNCGSLNLRKKSLIEFELLESHMIECFVLFLVAVSSKDRDIIDFRLFAKLNAFCVTVCDERNNIAEIKIQGKSFHTVKNCLKDNFLKKC